MNYWVKIAMIGIIAGIGIASVLLLIPEQIAPLSAMAGSMG